MNRPAPLLLSLWAVMLACAPFVFLFMRIP